MCAVAQHAGPDAPFVKRAQRRHGVRAQVAREDFLIRPADHTRTPELVRGRRAATAFGDPAHGLLEVTARAGRAVGEGCRESVVEVVCEHIERGGDAVNSCPSLGSAGAHRQGAVEVENYRAHDHVETLTCGVAEQDLVTYYKLRAPEYDKVYDRPDRQDDIGALRRLLPPAVTGRRVLELAAGTGYWTPLIAASAASVVATDINPETLAIAEARDYADAAPEFRIADAYAPETVAGEFDCIVAGYFLSHVPRDRVVPFLESAVRRVGSGGRVILFDNRYVPAGNLAISGIDQDGNTYQTRRLDSGDRFEVLKNFYDRDDLERLVRPYATTIEIQSLTYYWFLCFQIA